MNTLTFTLDYTCLANESLETSIQRCLEQNQPLFMPLLKRLTDHYDERTTIKEASLRATQIIINQTSGQAQLSYKTHFFAGCQGINECDLHQYQLLFTLDQQQLHIHIHLPPAWHTEDDDNRFA